MKDGQLGSAEPSGGFSSAAAADQELLITSQVGLSCLVGLGKQTGLWGRAVRVASEVLVLRWLWEQWVPCEWGAQQASGGSEIGLGEEKLQGGGGLMESGGLQLQAELEGFVAKTCKLVNWCLSALMVFKPCQRGNMEASGGNVREIVLAEQ